MNYIGNCSCCTDLLGKSKNGTAYCLCSILYRIGLSESGMFIDYIALSDII
jgi:hypothetical protein